MKIKVLYVEDEPFLSKVVKEMLENKGYEVHHESNGMQVMTGFKNFKPDICLLDVMLPDMDGYMLGKSIRRADENMPIIFLTAKTQTADVVKGFESGGTDYMRKPFSVEELEARIQNQLSIKLKTKKSVRHLSNEDCSFGSCTFNSARMELTVNGLLTRLSHKESQILQYFVLHQNSVIDRKELLMTVWGDDSFFNSRTLDVYIRKFREYFKPVKGIEIITLKGKGYQFIVPRGN
ncbi:MAG TPA: response regulator transcription factor [Flavobacteriales bacterium]|nr:response regulator transcription factor [Flavobacteriales bacterium]